MSLSLEVVDPYTVRDEQSHEYDVFRAINALRWVSQLCPLMPHEYARRSEADPHAYAVLNTMVSKKNPETYSAYFRGYQKPGLYWEAPDGLRYWSSGHEIDRCVPATVEPLRRVDVGAAAIEDWDGAPWAPNGSGLYSRRGTKWWPTPEALANGLRPCRSCCPGNKRPRSAASGWICEPNAVDTPAGD
jgi:hypothetical protein